MQDEELRSNLAEFLRALDDREQMMQHLNTLRRDQTAAQQQGRRRPKTQTPKSADLGEAVARLKEAWRDAMRTVRRDNTERSAMWSEALEGSPDIYTRIDQHGSAVLALSDDDAIAEHVQELLDYTTIESEIDLPKIVPALYDANANGGTAKLLATLFDTVSRPDVRERHSVIRRHTDGLRSRGRELGLIG